MFGVQMLLCHPGIQEVLWCYKTSPSRGGHDSVAQERGGNGGDSYVITRTILWPQTNQSWKKNSWHGKKVTQTRLLCFLPRLALDLWRLYFGDPTWNLDSFMQLHMNFIPVSIGKSWAGDRHWWSCGRMWAFPGCRTQNEVPKWVWPPWQD